ncbi:Uncharacterised protein [Vibrio cholerae]|nr:Uncharacterised protein [Vibrio cholerae]
MFGKQVDHGGAQFKATHLFAFFENHCLVTVGWVVPTINGVATRRSHGARPNQFNTADNGGANQHLCHWAKFCIENTHHTLVAGKQVRYIFRCQRVYREQIARYVSIAPN